MKTLKFLAAALSTAMCLQGAAAFAADTANIFPRKPIRLIVPNNPGSSVDTTGRIFGVGFGEVLGQQIVIDNRGGAGGAIGMEIGKNANTDGYTLIWASTAAMTIRPHIRKKLPYDPIKDYEFISIVGITPNVLVLNPKAPAKSMNEFLTWTKGSRGQIKMASAGVGSQSHVSGMALAVAAGIEPLHIPYKGGGSLVAAMISGESEWAITPAPAVMQHVKAGRLRALGHSLPQNSPIVPGLPPIGDTVKGFEYSGWLGLLAPKGTSKAITAKLRAALIQTLNKPDTKRRMEQAGVLPKTSTSEDFRKFVSQAIIDTGKIVRAAGLKPE
jgi:tripartite-type tricarboxylate transporter receptor subunit TctC